MRIILEIPEETLLKVGEVAKKQHRSRKNLLETLVIAFGEGTTLMPTQNAVQVQNHTVEQPKNNSMAIVPPIPKISQYDAFLSEIMAAKSVAQFPGIVSSIKEDKDLTHPQRLKLEAIAIQRSKEIDV